MKTDEVHWSVESNQQKLGLMLTYCGMMANDIAK